MGNFYELPFDSIPIYVLVEIVIQYLVSYKVQRILDENDRRNDQQ